MRNKSIFFFVIILMGQIFEALVLLKLLFANLLRRIF